MDKGYLLQVTIREGDFYRATPHTQSLSFVSKAAAIAQLREVEPKIGMKCQNDPEKVRHTFVCDDGELTVIAEDIVAVRVLDEDAFLELTQNQYVKRMDAASDAMVACLSKFKDAGLLDTISADKIMEIMNKTSE